MDAKQTYYAGIDVSKEHLDVVLRPTGEYLRANNDERGIESLVARLKEASPVLVVVEATGGMEQPVAAALAVDGLPVAVVNPRQVRDFAKAVGRLAKTDRIDAAVLAHFAEAVRPEPRPLADEHTRELSALVLRGNFASKWGSPSLSVQQSGMRSLASYNPEHVLAEEAPHDAAA